MPCCWFRFIMLPPLPPPRRRASWQPTTSLLCILCHLPACLIIFFLACCDTVPRRPARPSCPLNPLLPDPASCPHYCVWQISVSTVSPQQRGFHQRLAMPSLGACAGALGGCSDSLVAPPAQHLLAGRRLVPAQPSIGGAQHHGVCVGVAAVTPTRIGAAAAAGSSSCGSGSIVGRSVRVNPEISEIKPPAGHEQRRWQNRSAHQDI